MKRLLKKLLWVLVLVLVLAPVSFSKELEGLEYADYQVSELPTNAPTQVKKLLGKWEGYFIHGPYNKQYASLTIININISQNNALVKYAWGSSNGSNPGYIYVVASIKASKNPEIKWEKYNRGFKFTFNGGVLNGIEIHNQYSAFVKMRKAKPDPDEYKVSKLPNDAPAPLKKLIGTWDGIWNNTGHEGLKAILSVKNINIKQNKALIMYAWGKYGNYNAGYAYMIARIIDNNGNINLNFGRAKFKFVLKGNVLYGSSGRYTSTIQMRKIKK